MARKPEDDFTAKSGLHPRNRMRFRYDFGMLIGSCPTLERFVIVNRFGDESVDFADPAAVAALNRALLACHYGISDWTLPEGRLCPPIPGRADYIHHAADLLGSSNGGVIPKGKRVRVLDIGVGANCVYPIVGACEYGWHFTGSDIDPVSVEWAKRNADGNAVLSGLVEVRLQESPACVFRGVVRQDDCFDLSICNPPFHASAEEAAAGTSRKARNLKTERIGSSRLNFGGNDSELWTQGGESRFIGTMIEESAKIPLQCLWFTTIVSKSSNLARVHAALERSGVDESRTIEMAQGQKSSRIVAWTFLSALRRAQWARERWG